MSSSSTSTSCTVVVKNNFQDAQPASLYEPTPLVEYLSELQFLPSSNDDLVEWMRMKNQDSSSITGPNSGEYPLRLASLPLLGSTMALVWGLFLLLAWKCRGSASYFWSGGNRHTVKPPPLAPPFSTTGVVVPPALNDSSSTTHHHKTTATSTTQQSRWRNKYHSSSWMSNNSHHHHHHNNNNNNNSTHDSSSSSQGEGRGGGVRSTSSSVDTCKHANVSTTLVGATTTTTTTPYQVFFSRNQDDEDDNDEDEVSSQHSWMLELSQSRGGRTTTNTRNLLCLEESSSSSSSSSSHEEDHHHHKMALGTTTISEMTSLYMDDEDNDNDNDNEKDTSRSLLFSPATPSSSYGVYPLPMGLHTTTTETTMHAIASSVSPSSSQHHHHQHPYAEFIPYLQEVSGAYSSEDGEEDDDDKEDHDNIHHDAKKKKKNHYAASSSLQDPPSPVTPISHPKQTLSHVSRDSADWLLEQVLNGSSRHNHIMDGQYGHDHADFDFDDEEDDDDEEDHNHNHNHSPTPSSPTLLRETWPATHELLVQHPQSSPLNTSFPQEEEDPHFFLQDDEDEDEDEVTRLPPTTPAPMTTMTTMMTTPMVQAHYKRSSTTTNHHDHHVTTTTTTPPQPPPPQSHRNWLVTDDSQLLGDVSGIVIRSAMTPTTSTTAVSSSSTPIAPQLLAELSLAESASGLLSEDDDDDDDDNDENDGGSSIVAIQTFSAMNTSLLDEEPTQDDEVEDADDDILPNNDTNNTSSVSIRHEVDAVLDMMVMPSSSVESSNHDDDDEEVETKKKIQDDLSKTTKSRTVIQRAAQETDSTQNVEDSESSYSSQDDDQVVVVTTEDDSFLDHPATDEQAWKEYEVAYGKWQAQHLQFLSRLNRWRNCVVVACTILVGATIMGALNGVYALESQKQTVTEAWEAVQRVAQRTENDLIEVVQRQVLWNQDMDTFWQILDQHCPLLDANLCSTSTDSLAEEVGGEDRDGSAVSFNCNVTGIPLQDEWQDWLDVYQSPTLLQDQLVSPEDWGAWAWDAHDFEELPVTEGLEGWNWAFWAAVACNALLSGACIWILMAIAVERSPRIQNHLATWSFAILYWVTLGLSWIFGILFWVGTILTVDTCTAASDEGGNGREGPSTIAKLLMDRHFGGKDSEDSTSLPTFWDYHMDGCLPEEYPTFLNDRVRVWAEYLPVTTQLVQGLENFSELEFLQRCGAPIGPLKEAASNLNLQTCRVTSSLTQVRESLGCDEWYPWYESMVPNAICEQGSKAFVWSSACQMVILFLGFFIWTFRASFVSLAVQPTRPPSRTSSGRSQVEDSIYGPTQGGETTGHYRIT